MNTLRPFFSFYGSKWRAVKHYPKPEHPQIVEPFAGSAGYSTRYYQRKIVLYEIDPIIYGIWKYLITAPTKELKSLPTKVTTSVEDLKVCQEAKWLIGFWLNKACVCPKLTPSKWMREYESTQFWGDKIKHRIVNQSKLIGHWKIFNKSYETLPNKSRTYFIDPPYNNPAGRLYVFNKLNYKQLAKWVKTLNGQVIVCEQEGATWLPFKHLATIKTLNGANGKGTSNEVIYLKGGSTI